MPIRFTPLVNDNYYHVYNRGVNRRKIYLNSHDYNRILNLLKFYNFLDAPIRFSKFMLLTHDMRREIWKRLENSPTYVDILSYCFMPNHFHLLVKQRIDNGVTKFLGNFQNSYAKYFNIKNGRQGPLFQNRFKVKKIETEEQLLHVSRYIHLNPYSSSIIKDISQLQEYEWCSMKEYVSDHATHTICNKGILLSYFDSNSSFKEFIEDNSEYQKSLESIKHLVFE